MNIVYKDLLDEYVVEIHCNKDDTLRTIEIGNTVVPFRDVLLRETELTITIPFKDLTIYDIASYKERRASLMDMEQNDGDDRGNS